ncbi:MAG: glucose-1-phosphate cytidylyltransferase [Planctomycetota bacterium]|jgi:glucose-1-phosphate cytidylyltransferase
MKVAILAGGFGSRLAEETEIRPKPMVEIGGRPILWHIMKHYSHHGLNDFVIALGYKGEHIKKYMVDYCSLNGNLTVTLRTGNVVRHGSNHEQWTVDLIDTGIQTLTGGRIKRLKPYLGDETFMLTWGDGVSDVDLSALLEFHRSHGKLATVTAVRPRARYGHMAFDGDRVAEFSEKPETAEGWINGEPMKRLAADGQLMAYRHSGFWQCMDTLREKKILEDLWDAGDPPWKTWA